MTLIICPLHGPQPNNAVCTHVADEMSKGRVFYCIRTNTDRILWPNLSLCTHCDKVWNGRMADLEREDFLDEMPIVCAKCFSEKGTELQ